MNFNLIEKAIYDWIKAVTKRESIKENQNSPRPLLPYLTFKIRSVESLGTDFFGPVDETTGKAKVKGVRRAILIIESFGYNSMSVLEDLAMSPINYYYSKILSDVGIAILNKLSINDLTGLSDTIFEERAEVNFNILIGRESEEKDEIDIGIIETTILNETIKNEGSAYIDLITITSDNL